jgi:hypothetical protein
MALSHSPRSTRIGTSTLVRATVTFEMKRRSKGSVTGARVALVARVRDTREAVRVVVVMGASTGEVTVAGGDLSYPFGYNDVE